VRLSSFLALGALFLPSFLPVYLRPNPYSHIVFSFILNAFYIGRVEEAFGLSRGHFEELESTVVYSLNVHLKLLADDNRSIMTQSIDKSTMNV
jgi:hypothetical protein